MPELQLPQGLQLDADLQITFSGEGGDASAHLHGGSDGLVLDVDHPAVLLGEARRQELPLLAVRQVLSDTPVRVRSQGRELARVRLTPAGRLRLRPTPLGVVTVLKIGLVSRRGKALGLLGAVGLTAAIVSSRRR